MKINLNKQDKEVRCKICYSRWLWGAVTKDNKDTFICPNCKHKIQLIIENYKGDVKEKNFLKDFINKLI